MRAYYELLELPMSFFSSDGVTTFEDVAVKNIYGAENLSKIKIITRTEKECFFRSAKRSGKIIGVICLVAPIAIFVHLLLLLGLLTLLFAVGLFFWGLGDRVTFEYVEGQCPTCKKILRLTPFSSSRVNYPLSVLCSQCGGTFTAVLAR